MPPRDHVTPPLPPHRRGAFSTAGAVRIVVLRRRVIADPCGAGEADGILRQRRDQPQDAGRGTEHDLDLRPEHRQRLAVPVVGHDVATGV